MTRPSVAVVGGGVIGRTAAIELARAGHAVTLISKDDPEDTTSALAGAWWMPVYAEPMARLVAWGATTYRRLLPLAADPRGTGVQLLPTVVYYTTPDPDLGWMDVVDGAEWHEGTGAGPADVRSRATAVLPCIDMPVHLRWLQAEQEALGVTEIRHEVESVAEARSVGELVVLATGLESNALVDDAAMYPIQGQTVRVRNPGGIGVTSYENADITIYVIPRLDEIVIGGTHVARAWSTEPDPALEAELLRRAVALVPELAGLPVTSRAVGLRPGRDAARLERIGDVIHCYGHGGSGVTVSWGCAAEIARLAVQ